MNTAIIAQGLDIVTLGTMTIGFVNIVLFFKPDLDSKIKILLAFLFAFAWGYVPATIAVDLLNRLKIAIEIALSSSGIYKLVTKAGGN